MLAAGGEWVQHSLIFVFVFVYVLIIFCICICIDYICINCICITCIFVFVLIVFVQIEMEGVAHAWGEWVQLQHTKVVLKTQTETNELSQTQTQRLCGKVLKTQTELVQTRTNELSQRKNQF